MSEGAPSLFVTELAALVAKFPSQGMARRAFGITRGTLKKWLSGDCTTYAKVLARVVPILRDHGMTETAIEGLVPERQAKTKQRLIERAKKYAEYRLQGMTLMAIGAQEGLTHERVRQILKYTDPVIYTCATEGCNNKRVVQATLCRTCNDKCQQQAQHLETATKFAVTGEQSIARAFARFKEQTRQEGDHLIWTGKTCHGSPWMSLSDFGAIHTTSPRHVSWWLRHHEVLTPGTHLFVSCENNLCLTHLTPNLSEAPHHYRSKLTPTCRRGHPRTPEHLYVSPSGLRYCRTCQVMVHKGEITFIVRATARKAPTREFIPVKVRANHIMAALVDGRRLKTQEIVKLLGLSESQVYTALRFLLTRGKIQKYHGPSYAAVATTTGEAL